MPELHVGDLVYEGTYYKKVGTIGHILEDREKYGAPYSVTFIDPDPDQPGRDYFSREQLHLVLPIDYQTPAEKELRARVRQIEQLIADIPDKPDVEGLPDWEVGAERANAAMARKIRSILHDPVVVNH